MLLRASGEGRSSGGTRTHNPQAEEAEWSRNGHGHLTHLTETKEFFDASKKSKLLVCHFMRPTSHHCVALNGHIAKLASLHRETRFCTFDAEKSPYLCDKILADQDGNVFGRVACASSAGVARGTCLGARRVEKEHV